MRELGARGKDLNINVEAFKYDATLRKQILVKQAKQLEEIYKEAKKNAK